MSTLPESLTTIVLNLCCVRHFVKEDLPRIRYANPTVDIHVNKVQKTKEETLVPEMVVELSACLHALHAYYCSKQHVLCRERHDTQAQHGREMVLGHLSRAHGPHRWLLVATMEERTGRYGQFYGNLIPTAKEIGRSCCPAMISPIPTYPIYHPAYTYRHM